MSPKIDRTELIKSCSLEFMKRGYYGTSMSDLGQACGGMEKSHFYYYFKSKDALFIEVLNYLKNESLDYIFTHKEKDLNPDDALLAITSKALTYFTEHQTGCFFGKTVLEVSSLQNETINKVLEDYFTTWYKHLSKIYKTFYKKKTAKELAILSIQDLQGAFILQQLHKEDKYVKKSLDRMFDRVLSGL